MEKGKLYKSTIGGLVVFCTTVIDDEFFSGVVVDSGDTNLPVGFVSYDSNQFQQKTFEEYTLMTQAQVLTNGHRYNIPNGCKARVEGGVIIIESNVKHYKKDNISYQKYTRINGDKMIKMLISSYGEKGIFFRDGLTGGEHGEECTEEEFMKVYNSIKIEL